MGIFGSSGLFGKRRRYDDEEDVRQPFDESEPWSKYAPSNLPGFPSSGPQNAPKRSGGILGEDGFDKVLRAYALAKGDISTASAISAGMSKPKLAAAKRQQGREDYLWQQQNKAPSTYRWEDNGGNLMELGPDGKPRQVYQDTIPKMMFIPDGMGGGRSVPIPGTGGSAQQKPPAQSAPQIGTVEDGFEFQGGDPGDPESWKPVGGGRAPYGTYNIPSGNPLMPFPRRR